MNDIKCNRCNKEFSPQLLMCPGCGKINFSYFVPLAIVYTVLLVSFYFLYIVPFLKVTVAKKWKETKCKIISSEVKPVKNKYTLKIEYSYKIEDKEYKSNTYGLSFPIKSGDINKIQDIVNQFPPGKETVCYVNPENPSESSIDRGWSNFNILPFIIQIIMIIIITGSFILLRLKQITFRNG